MTTDDFLLPLRERRREPVRMWLTGSIGDCSDCGRPVSRTDAHRAADGGFRHLSCDSAASAATDPGEPVSKNVDANARRADWG
jgi:hypothetical protein